MGRDRPLPQALAAGRTGGRWEAPVESVVAVLELTASERPELLEFQTHVLRNSTMSFALQQLADTFEVPPDQIGQAVFRAGKDLDRLETLRVTWRDPAKVLDSPNLPALLYLGHARLARVSKLIRRRRLEVTLRRVQRAYDLARSRAWIEAFIGPPLPKSSREQDVDR